MLSQTKYSNDPDYVLSRKQYENPFSTRFLSAYPDTGVVNLHNYTHRNYSGNLGLMEPDYFLKYNSNPLGFNLYKLPYQQDLLHSHQIQYYKTKGPYASLSGFAGSKNEQTFRLLFSHTTKKNLNITVQFNRFGSLGYYLKQQTFTNNFSTSLNYHTKNNRFGFTGYFLFNRIKHQENGGIKYDTIIEDRPTIGKDLLQVNLSNARRDNRMLEGSINPWFRLNKNDSGNVSHYIDYKINYSGNYYWYLDQNIEMDGFYNTFYLDTTKTSDSTHHRKVSNRINYTFQLNKTGLSVSAGYAHEYNFVYQHGDSVLNNQLIHGKISYYKLFVNKDSSVINRNKLIHSELRYSYVFEGANGNDSKTEWVNEVRFRVNDKGINSKKTTGVFFNVLSEQRQPDFIYNYWYTNHFRWNNNFKQIQLFQLQAGAINYFTGLSASVLWENIGNYIYMDSMALPKQTNIIISNWAYKINFNKVLFKHLGIGLHAKYQTTNKNEIVRLAPLQLKGSLYYTGNLFKNNLQLQIGAQGEYFQAFKSLAYMPAYNMYYLQNRHTAGEYPFVDVFLNARIKPVQLFVKVENVLYGMAGTNYDFVQGYFQPDRAFRFGLTWLFFD